MKAKIKNPYLIGLNNKLLSKNNIIALLLKTIFICDTLFKIIALLMSLSLSCSFGCAIENGTAKISYNHQFTYALIRKVASKCCDAEMASCCAMQMRADETLTPCDPMNISKTLRAAACVERALYNTGEIEKQLYDCCPLLRNEACQRYCAENVRRPTLSLEDKYSMTNACPERNDEEQRQDWYSQMRSLRLLTDEDKPDERYACIWRTKYKLHDCFGTCLNHQRNRAQNELPFDPKIHCQIYRKFVAKNPCEFIVGEI